VKREYAVSSSISDMKNRVIAIVPFFNEADTLPKLFEILKTKVDLIIAVNDGSTDDWQTRIEPSEKIIIIHHKKNLGKGAALKTGFLKALEIGGYATVTIDADLQHDPRFIPKFIEQLKHCDFVVGNRLKNLSTMPLLRRASNFITSFLLTIKTGAKIADSQCGFRAIKTELIPKILTDEKGFEAESLMLINAARNGLKICFHEIPTIYGNDNSKMRNIRAIIGFIKILFK